MQQFVPVATVTSANLITPILKYDKLQKLSLTSRRLVNSHKENRASSARDDMNRPGNCGDCNDNRLCF